MFKHIFKLTFIFSFFLICCFIIYTTEDINIETINSNFKIKYNEIVNNIYKDNNIGKLVINKINREFKIYDINDSKNNVEENVTILNGSIEPNNENSIMFLAAHSGSGKIAFFNDLDKLSIDDEIVLEYKNNKYIYKVYSIWETEKDGDIEINKLDSKQLILTTCSKKDKTKQLIINCTIKES